MENYIVSARKYRPSTFESVVGQRALTTTLKNAIATQKLAHAYLFCGPRGVGKTTCARIFAKTINCMTPTADGEACNECESCVAFNEQRSYNIHELDAASNNSVDDIRQLVEQVRIPPQIGKYKVYIIDEVHMLSASAFNAFLKTLEEPPRHAIFILATTEKHKILPTILSRCQIYDFNRISVEDTVNHLSYVAAKENITAEPEALNVIAMTFAHRDGVDPAGGAFVPPAARHRAEGFGLEGFPLPHHPRDVYVPAAEPRPETRADVELRGGLFAAAARRAAHLRHQPLLHRRRKPDRRRAARGDDAAEHEHREDRQRRRRGTGRLPHFGGLVGRRQLQLPAHGEPRDRRTGAQALHRGRVCPGPLVGDYGRTVRRGALHFGKGQRPGHGEHRGFRAVEPAGVAAREPLPRAVRPGRKPAGAALRDKRRIPHAAGDLHRRHTPGFLNTGGKHYF